MFDTIVGTKRIKNKISFQWLVFVDIPFRVIVRRNIYALTKKKKIIISSKLSFVSIFQHYKFIAPR